MDNKNVKAEQDIETKGEPTPNSPAPAEAPIAPLERHYYEVELHKLKEKLNRLEETNRHLREKISEAEKEKETYRDLYENAPVGYHLLAPDGTILQLNKAALEMLGYRSEELIGKSYKDSILADSSKELFSTHYEKLRGSGKLSTLEINLLAKNGLEIPVLLSANATYDNEQKIVRYRAAVRNIAKRKELESELLRIKRYRILGAMCKNIAHNFNNLLTCVMGNIQIMHMTGAFDTQQKRRLDMINAAAKKMARLVTEIQSFVARADDHGEPEPQYIDINEALKQAIELTRPKWRDEMTKKNVKIDIEFEPVDIPRLKGNLFEYRTAFSNILTNAIEAIEARIQRRGKKKQNNHKITITETVVKKDAESRESVEIVFKDTGVGMVKKVQEAAIDPLYSTKGLVGVGMGLSVAYSTVNKAGGTLSLESTPLKGTEVHILLPISSPPSVKKGVTRPRTRPSTMQKSVLLVEDDDSVRFVLETMLQKLNCDVSAVSSGKEALDLFDKKTFNVVLADWSMPTMNGIELARRLREVKADLPIVIITGWTDEESLGELKKQGIERIIKKPFVMEKIKDLISDMFA
jgi:PAS domain S-box-containing protein